MGGFGLLKGFGALLLIVLAGCGGRSSMLDPDAVSVEANQPAGGSTASPGSSTVGSGAKTGAGATGSAAAPRDKVPTGGSAGSGNAGSTPTPGERGAAGAASGGASGFDPVTIGACNDYCIAGTQGPCPSLSSAAECASSCSSELLSQTLACQKLGSTLLSCLTTVYKNSNSCSEVDQLSAAKCSALFASYQGCVAPTPDPMPTQLACSSSGSSSNGKCGLKVECTSGAYYTVSCSQTSPDQSSCTCNSIFPNGSGTGANFFLDENATFACYDSLATCGFPQVGAK